MIELIHEHILGELDRNSKVDQLFVTIAILLNILVLASNSAIAASEPSGKKTTILLIFILLAVVINTVVISELLKGKQTKVKLITGLLQIYKDQGVDKYYEPSVLKNYKTRYDLFIFAVVFMGAVSIIVPLLLW